VSHSATSSPGWRSRSRSRRTGAPPSIGKRSRRSRLRRRVFRISHCSRTMRRRPATLRRCCASRRGRLRARLHSAPIERPQPSTRERSVSATVYTSKCGPNSSACVPSSVTSRTRTPKRWRLSGTRSTATGSSATRRREGDSLRSLSEFLWCPGRTAEAERAGREAVAVLEELPPGGELAMAYGNLATFGDSVALGTRALELAHRSATPTSPSMRSRRSASRNRWAVRREGSRSSLGLWISPAVRGFPSR
jgi:hypothetical protein